MNSIVRSALSLRAVTNSLRILSSRQTQKLFSTKPTEAVSNEPVKFLGSEAHKWKAKTNRVGSSDPDEMFYYQPIIVVASLAIFMIYFFILREENDIDAHLGKDIFQVVPQLEKSTLITLYKYNLEQNLDNTDVIKRLIEIGVDPLQIE